MVKPEYWNISDSESVAKTGMPLAHWIDVLDRFGASATKSNDAVSHLQSAYGLGRYWARTLTTHYLKKTQA